jgi:hypothetical protein
MHGNSSCKVSQLLSAAAAAAALHGSCLSAQRSVLASCRLPRASPRATLNVRRDIPDIDMWQPSRCRRQRLR